MFELDNLVLKLIKNLFATPNIQFSALVGVWILAEIALPNKKVKR